MRKPYVLVLPFLALCAAPVAAHHSRANYDSNQPIEFMSTIMRVEWKNPHVYVHLERTGPDGTKEEWVAEMGSIQNLKQIGLSETDLKVGDVGTIAAIRDRNPDKHLLMWRSFTKADGTRLGRAPGAERAEATAPRGPGSKDFTGVWGGARVEGGGRPKMDRYPLTEKGNASLATYRKEGEEGDPVLDCEKQGVPRTIYIAYVLEILREPNIVHLNWEYNEVHRPVYLDQKTHPANGKRTHQGYSIGRFEGNTLVVDTANFAPQKWGNGVGLDSSDQKRVVERYALEDDGHALRVEYTVTDPVYLSKPVTEVVRFQERPGYVVSDWKCDVGASRKHLSK